MLWCLRKLRLKDRREEKERGGGKEIEKEGGADGRDEQEQKCI